MSELEVAAYPKRIPILDHGYLELIEFWGSDQRIIESARMSTNKGFEGWGPFCSKCGIGVCVQFDGQVGATNYEKGNQVGCEHDAKKTGDEKLLRYLWENAHHTPFEMAGLTIEVKAPIVTFREWHRHRIPFGYNEMSARYVPLPNENYYPTVERIVSGAKVAGKNRQAQGMAPLDEDEIDGWLRKLNLAYTLSEQVYQDGLAIGIPKELARLPVPVARYSRMRATSNLRGWLAFMKLRCAPNAQYEIRVYADAVGQLIRGRFPRTHELWLESSMRVS